MKKNNVELSDSMEDYLEIILELEKTYKVARVKDIAEKIGVLRGSVSSALKNLAEKGLINYAPYSFITLTRKGLSIAKETTVKHRVIKDFLQNVLLLNHDKAEENACRMEHAIDKVAINRLVQFIEYIHHCPRAGEDWIQAFVNYYSTNTFDKKQCKPCIEHCVAQYQK